MSSSFLIVIAGQFSCSLKRMGDTEVRKFSTVAEAVEDARRTLDGAAGQVTVTNPADGSTQVIKIDAGI